MLGNLCKKRSTKILAALATVIVLILVLTLGAFAADQPGSVGDYVKFNKNMDVWFMLMLVAFLMTFIRKFEWSICLAVILVAASSFLTYTAIGQLVLKTPPEQLWSQESMIGSVTCAITVVIAIGTYVGTVKTWQYLLSGVLFAPVFHILEYLLYTWIPQVMGGEITDPGGGILVHFFAAYFGWGVILAIREKRAFDEPMLTTKHSVAFAWLAAMLLFILWPSFVTALIDVEEVTLVMINCYLSGLGSMITAYLTCVACSKNRKVNPLVFMYAMLAGPVASSSTLLLAGPWISLLIGAVAGVVVTLCFLYLNGWLCGKLGVLDVMGVHNLHGIGGWISLLTGAMLAGSLINLWAGILTLVYGIVAGLIVGCILRATRGQLQVLFSDSDVFEDYGPDPLADRCTGEPDPAQQAESV